MGLRTGRCPVWAFRWAFLRTSAECTGMAVGHMSATLTASMEHSCASTMWTKCRICTCPTFSLVSPDLFVLNSYFLYSSWNCIWVRAALQRV